MKHFALFLSLASLAAPVFAQAPAPSAAQKASAAIKADTLKAHIGFLASDLLEGRGPATRGDQLAEAYIVSQMEHAGLEPGAPDGTWLQPFDVFGIDTAMPETFTFKKGDKSVTVKSYDEFIAFADVPKEEVKLDDAEVVFVGYGIQAPEYQVGRLQGRGPQGQDPADDEQRSRERPQPLRRQDASLLRPLDLQVRKRRTPGRRGRHHHPHDAVGRLPVQVVQSGWTGERFSIPPAEGEELMALKGWCAEDTCRKIAALGGADLDTLRAAAEKADFKPVPLGVTLSAVLKNQVKKKQTANVIGKLPGADPVLAKEAVIYSAHHDHLGINPNAKPGEDAIYNGAIDNASGVAGMLAIADAFQALQPKPKRTIYFAAVAAEEQGLLGSEYLSNHLPIPAGKFVANINMDGLGMMGKTRDFGVIGLGKSSLDDFVKAAALAQKRTIVGDQFPDKGFYYRSDHFNFAKVGIPASHFNTGTDVIGKPAGYGKQKKEDFEAKDYHQPSDEVRSDWDYSGAVQDAQLLFDVGVRVANSVKTPAWKPGDEFEAVRKKSLAGK